MNQLFENERNTMVEDYERKLKELEAQKNAEFNSMQTDLQEKIRDLEEQLRKERANM